LLTGWSAGSSVSKDSTVAGLTITATSVAALQDGTVVGADLVVGPTGTTTHEYDGAADVSSTSATSRDNFAGETAWGIQYCPGGGTASTCTATGGSNGYIPANAQVQVVYLPQSVSGGDVQYLKAGSKVSLPNNFADLGFIGFNTDTFSTVTVKALRSTVSAYNSTDNQIGTSFYGISIQADKSVIYSSAGNTFDQAYVLFNASRSTSSPYQFPIAVGFYDETKGHIIVNDNFATASANGNGLSAEYAWFDYNMTGTPFTYSFRVNVGEFDYYINVRITNSSTASYPDLINVTATNTSSTVDKNGAVAMYQIDGSWDTTTAGKLKLGSSSGSTDTNEITVSTENAIRDGSNKAQEIVTDAGIIVEPTSSSTTSDAMIVNVPAKNLAVQAYFGQLGATTTGGSVNAAIPVTSSVAKLDSEITSAEEQHNLVVVGDAAVNTIAAQVMNLTYPTYGSSGLFPYTSGQGYIKIYDGFYTPGKVVLLVAGWDASDTRNAASVLQQYATLLKGSTATAIKVTSATATGITPA